MVLVYNLVKSIFGGIKFGRIGVVCRIIYCNLPIWWQKLHVYSVLAGVAGCGCCAISLPVCMMAQKKRPGRGRWDALWSWSGEYLPEHVDCRAEEDQVKIAVLLCVVADVVGYFGYVLRFLDGCEQVVNLGWGVENCCHG